MTPDEEEEEAVDAGRLLAYASDALATVQRDRDREVQRNGKR